MRKSRRPHAIREVLGPETRVSLGVALACDLAYRRKSYDGLTYGLPVYLSNFRNSQYFSGLLIFLKFYGTSEDNLDCHKQLPGH